MDTTVYKAARFTVVKRPVPDRNGKTYTKDVVVHGGAVAIWAKPDDDHVIIIRTYRPAVDQTLIELPAGTLEPGEAPTLAAGRELLEETGYQADTITCAGSFFTAPGFCTERMHLFVATDLTYAGQQLEDDEYITAHVVSLDEFADYVRKGDIVDAKTLAAYTRIHLLPG